MAVKIKALEVAGNDADVQSAIQTAINGLTIAAASEPSISVAGTGPRFLVFILYRDA